MFGALTVSRNKPPNRGTYTDDRQTNETLSMATEAQLKRDLPQSIVIPPIRGEMVHLRPATVEDPSRLDELDAFCGASKITGKDAVTERAIVIMWVRRSPGLGSRSGTRRIRCG